MITILAQIFKHIAGIEINHWWLRLITYMVGTALLILGVVFTAEADADKVLICFINGAIVYFAATGEYHTILKELSEDET